MKNRKTPQVVVNMDCHTGEGPLWHPDQQCVFFVDIPASKLFRYDPHTQETQTFETGSPVGGFTLHEDGRLLLFMAEGAVKLWNDGEFETVISSLDDEKGNRFNDVIADPEGRVFCGVMSTEKRSGRLYRLDPDGTITVVIEGTGTANGMGFSPDLTHMYFCDSGKAKIYVFDYDRDSGEITNERVLAAPDASEGRPDGMTVDSEGFIWSARWDGSAMFRLTSEGETIEQIDFPVKKVSSVAFGGRDMTDMYITTAGGNNKQENGDMAGSLFHINLGVKGREEFRSRLN